MAVNLKLIGRSLIFVAVIGFPMLVQGEQEDEDMLFFDLPSVFTASKYEQKISDAPARVSVITAKEIQRYGYRNLAEALRSMPGLQSSYDHSYSYLGVRGLNIPGDFNSRVLVLVDGHRINENIYDSVVVDYGNIVDIDMIKQIEMIRGPASSLYGSSAFLGVINIITKDGRDINGIQLSADTGSHDTYQGRISYGKQYDNDLEVLLSASSYSSEGADRYFAEFDDPATNNGVAVDADGGKNDSLLAKLNYGGFTLSAAYTEYAKKIPTASYGTIFNDSRSLTTKGRSYINLGYDTLLEGGADLSAKLYYDEYWYDGDFVYNYPPVTKYIDTAASHWWGLEAQLTKVFFDSHRITTGLEYRKNLKTEQKVYDVFDTYLDIDTNEKVYGLYLQDEWQISEHWTLNLGVRFDDYSQSKSSINPRIAGIWQAKQTTLKLLYSSAFRAPNAYELFYENTIAQKAARMLEPESIESYELIWEQQLSSSLHLITSVYHNSIEDMLILVTDPDDGFEIFDNTAEVESEGFELELLVNFSEGWSGSASYAYQKSQDGYGANLVNYAQNMFKLNALSPLIADNFLLGLELQYEDGRKTFAGSDTDSQILTNLTVSNNTMADELTLSAGIYNLFDETYSQLGFQEHVQNMLEQNGRTFRLKATYRF